eukprot:1092193-Prorocentrum_minimum.AAC.1
MIIHPHLRKAREGEQPLPVLPVCALAETEVVHHDGGGGVPRAQRLDVFDVQAQPLEAHEAYGDPQLSGLPPRRVSLTSTLDRPCERTSCGVIVA